MKRAYLVFSMLLVLLPATASAGTYTWEAGCFNAVSRCWATNFDPNAGSFGSQPRIDNLNQLPTWNGTFSYGNPGPVGDCNYPATLPSVGGDFAWGGHNSGSTCAPTPCPSTSHYRCNRGPLDFATENYTDATGAWHFAMGGNGKCYTDGTTPTVPCNLGHRMFAYDCLTGFSTGCVTTSPQDTPFNWGFPGDPKLQMTSRVFVGGNSGNFHGYLCVNLRDSAIPDNWLELCEEPWNSASPKYSQWEHLTCGNGGFVNLWEKAGSHAKYMDTGGAATAVTGQWINASWTMSRSQFSSLIGAAATSCNGGNSHFVADYQMNNWKIMYSENGMESAGGYSAYNGGISWMMENETISTLY